MAILSIVKLSIFLLDKNIPDYKTGAADQQKLLTKTTLTTPAEFAVLRYKKI